MVTFIIVFATRYTSVKGELLCHVPRQLKAAYRDPPGAQRKRHRPVPRSSLLTSSSA